MLNFATCATYGMLMVEGTSLDPQLLVAMQASSHMGWVGYSWGVGYGWAALDPVGGMVRACRFIASP